jgi:MraZ protein
MLIGEYTYTLDNKKRVAIPAKLRKEVGEKTILTRGFDNCLFLYPIAEWETMADKLNKLSQGSSQTRSFVRLMLSGAVEVDTDGLGRVLIPDYLKDYAGLKKDVVIAGVYNRLEIWDSEKWISYRQEAEKNTDHIAEQLGELGSL